MWRNSKSNNRGAIATPTQLHVRYLSSSISHADRWLFSWGHEYIPRVRLRARHKGAMSAVMLWILPDSKVTNELCKSVHTGLRLFRTKYIVHLHQSPTFDPSSGAKSAKKDHLMLWRRDRGGQTHLHPPASGSNSCVHRLNNLYFQYLIIREGRRRISFLNGHCLNRPSSPLPF